MKYAENILGIIGNTPLVKLNKIVKGYKPTVLVKLESINPGGSIKDRIAVAMIDEAEKEGFLKKGGTIVEPTSGNTGIGLAIAAAIKGYRAIFTMPDKMSKEKELLLLAYGAKVIRTPTDLDPQDPRSYYKVAERLVSEIPNAYSPNQYFNKVNPDTHYARTGPEIWNDTEGRVTHVIIGMGTGGTISGIGKYLKEKNSKIKIIGVDPEGSIFYHYFYKKSERDVHSYKTEGIGEDFIPGTIDFDVIDEIITVSDKQAVSFARKLAKTEGIIAGSSGGAALYAGLKIAHNLTHKELVVILLPDSGRNYMSTVYNNDWVKENGFL